MLDYDNEYANLIVNHNLSYETVNPDGQTKRGGANKGLLPTVVEKFLQRRLYFESISDKLHTESKEYLWCQQRIDSLKNILWNRYGNVRVFGIGMPKSVPHSRRKVLDSTMVSGKICDL